MSTSHILTRLANIQPSSRKSLTEIISSILSDKLERIIDTHNTASLIFIYKEEPGTRLLLKAEFGFGTATHKEIAWYEHIKQRGFQSGGEYVGSYIANSYAALLIKYVDGSSTVDELALIDEVDPGLVARLVRRAIDLDRGLFDETNIDATPDRVNAFYMEKYEKRRQEADAIPYLKNLFTQTFVTINGRKLSTPDVVVESIKTTPYLLDRLTPTRLGLVHGDLHCGNILTKGDEVILIDPNGNLVMPMEYDIGKILHSIHGHYGSIMRGAYTLIEDASLPYTFSFSVHGPKAYETALNGVREQITEDEYIRGLYAEALHFVTMLPHHAGATEETIALFLRSVELFDELMALVDYPLRQEVVMSA